MHFSKGIHNQVLLTLLIGGKHVEQNSRVILLGESFALGDVVQLHVQFARTLVH